MGESITNIIHVLLFSLGLGIGLYYAKYFKPFLLWLKGGVEDGDGKLENKELQIAFFSVLSAFMIISVAIWGTKYPDIAYYGAFGGAGILYSINRIAEAYQESNKKPPKDEK